MKDDAVAEGPDAQSGTKVSVFVSPPFGFKPQRDSQMTITVYSKPACVQCTATTRALEARGIAFSVIDLTEDAAAMEVVQGLGYRQAPVVVAGNDHWAGFRPDKISAMI
jgi:glutaredoxin-like protein NrdH